MTRSSVDERAEQLAELYLLIGPLYRRVLRVVEQAEVENRVSVGVRAVLDQLRRHGPMTVPQIGRSQSLSRQFVQRMVSEAGHLVELVDNPHHRRSRLVRLTAAGRAAIVDITTREHRQLCAVAELVTDTDVAGTRSVLQHMLDVLAEVE